MEKIIDFNVYKDDNWNEAADQALKEAFIVDANRYAMRLGVREDISVPDDLFERIMDKIRQHEEKK